jgi:alcohol dehydrogenase class IV
MCALRQELAVTGPELLVYDGGEAEAGFAGVERCAGATRDFAPSVVVGIGRGSNLDLAKVTAQLLTGRSVDDWAVPGAPAEALPIVALPTTAGTGSEMTPVAVLRDEARNLKVGLTSGASCLASCW